MSITHESAVSGVGSVVELDHALAEELRSEATRIVETSAGSWQRVLDAVADFAGSPTATRVAECVDAGRHPVVVRGLPTWDGYRTPPSRADADRDPQLPDLVPLLVMAGIGVPMAFACMQDGRLVQDVVAADVPTPPAEGAQGRALELHIEAGFARFKPDHVGLYCIYNDDRVGTILAPLHPDLIPADIAGPLSTARPKSLVKGTLDELDPASAIVERDDAFRVNYDLGYFEFDLTPEQQSALDALTSIVESSCRRVVLGPGEMVIWDNHTTIHGRDSYPLHYNGRDRWLKRVYSRRELSSVDDLLVDRSLNVFP